MPDLSRSHQAAAAAGMLALAAGIGSGVFGGRWAAAEQPSPRPSPTPSMSSFARDMLDAIDRVQRSPQSANVMSPNPTRRYRDYASRVFIKRSGAPPLTMEHVDANTIGFDIVNGNVVSPTSRIDSTNVPGCGKRTTYALSKLISNEDGAKLFAEAPPNTVFIRQADGVRIASPTLHGRGRLVIHVDRNTADEVPACPPPTKGRLVTP